MYVLTDYIFPRSYVNMLELEGNNILNIILRIIKFSTSTDRENNTVNKISKSKKMNTPINSLKFVNNSFSSKFIIVQFLLIK